VGETQGNATADAAADEELNASTLSAAEASIISGGSVGVTLLICCAVGYIVHYVRKLRLARGGSQRSDAPRATRAMARQARLSSKRMSAEVDVVLETADESLSRLSTERASKDDANDALSATCGSVASSTDGASVFSLAELQRGEPQPSALRGDSSPPPRRALTLDEMLASPGASPASSPLRKDREQQQQQLLRARQHPMNQQSVESRDSQASFAFGSIAIKLPRASLESGTSGGLRSTDESHAFDDDESGRKSTGGAAVSHRSISMEIPYPEVAIVPARDPSERRGSSGPAAVSALELMQPEKPFPASAAALALPPVEPTADEAEQMSETWDVLGALLRAPQSPVGQREQRASLSSDGDDVGPARARGAAPPPIVAAQSGQLRAVARPSSSAGPSTPRDSSRTARSSSSPSSRAARTTSFADPRMRRDTARSSQESLSYSIPEDDDGLAADDGAYAPVQRGGSELDQMLDA
jgi:hypothetical protein